MISSFPGDFGKMGGPGSGRCVEVYGPFVENVEIVLDIRDLLRRGLLLSSNWQRLRWHLDSGQVAEAAMRVRPDTVDLEYAINDVRLQDHLRLLQTPCPVATNRTWFGCPTCQRQVAVVYWCGSRFGCRSCLGLKYASKYSSALETAARRLDRARENLAGGAAPADKVPRRPRGMWRRTYHLLRERYLSAQRNYNAAVEREVAKLKAWRDHLAESAA